MILVRSNFDHYSVVFIMLINVKMPTIVGILTFMSRINFVLSCVEYGKSFITSGPGCSCLCVLLIIYVLVYSSSLYSGLICDSGISWFYALASI